MGGAGVTPLLGRNRELDAARRLTDVDGLNGVVLVGEAGIGKTSLWVAVVRHAEEAGFDVRIARPTEAEASFGFGVLGDLLNEIDERTLTALTPPQRRALEAALLLRDSEAEPPAPYAVAAAFLAALRGAAAERPVLIAIDDLQWVDPSSAVVLQYALRRADPGEIRFLLARREGEPETIDVAATPVYGRLETLTLRGLSFGATQHLLAGRGIDLARASARRVHEISNGNPYFALELGAAIQHGAVPSDGELPLPPTLLEVLGERLRRLTKTAELAVLTVAIGAELTLDRVASVLGTLDGVDAATIAGALVVAGGRVRLAHPLIGSAVRGRASLAERKRLHALLAETSDDIEERARHRAEATDPPDAAVAAELERALERAWRRGALDAAADLASEAVRFAADDVAKARYATDAARYLIEVGAFGESAEFAEIAVALLPNGRDRARALYVLSQSQDHQRALDVVDEAIEGAGDDRALRVRAIAQKVALISMSVVSIPEAAEIAAGGLELARDVDSLEVVEMMRIEAAWPTALLGRDIEPLIRGMKDRDTSVFDDAGRMRGIRAMWRGEVPQARAYFEAALERARDRGEEWSVFVYLHHLVELEVRIGDVDALESALDYIDVQAGGLPFARAGRLRGRAFAAAWRGQAEVVEELVGDIFIELRMRWHSLEATRARGVARLFAGDLEGAAADLETVTGEVRSAGVAEPGAFPASPDLVEALVQLGRIEDAQRELAWLEARASEQQHPWGLVVACRARGLLEEHLGHLEAAEASFSDGLARHSGLTLPLDEARTRVAFGRVLRRTNRRRDAREQLTRAVESLEALGVVPLAADARSELERVGGRARASGLTPTEERVAALVAEGRTNREVADELVVTVRAVEANLTRIYSKLGVRSRVELTRALADRDL